MGTQPAPLWFIRYHITGHRPRSEMAIPVKKKQRHKSWTENLDTKFSQRRRKRRNLVHGDPRVTAPSAAVPRDAPTAGAGERPRSSPRGCRAPASLAAGSCAGMQMMLQASAKSSLFLPQFRTPLGAAARTEFVGGCKGARGAEPAQGDSSTAKLHLCSAVFPSLGSVPSGPQPWIAALKETSHGKSFSTCCPPGHNVGSPACPHTPRQWPHRASCRHCCLSSWGKLRPFPRKSTRSTQE